MRGALVTAAMALMATLVFGLPQDSPSLSGITYLKSQQSSDGSFGTGTKKLIDTAEAATTVAVVPGNATPLDRAGAFAGGLSVKGTDALARKLIALSPSTADVAATKAALLAGQNVDGSWGAAKGHGGGALDTALAIRALSHARTLEPASVARAMLFLASTRTASGGWPIQEDGPADAYVTANVVHALAEFEARSGLAAEDLERNLIAGSAFILGEQAADGSFGADNKVATTAWSVMALLRTTQPASLATAATYLTSQQAANGSWSDDIHLTALAARALFEKATPPAPAPADLVVESIAFDPAAPAAGAPVFVTATIKNQGQRTARQAALRVAEGGVAFGQDTVFAELRPGERRSVTLTLALSPGPHTLAATADPENIVLESSDTNNSATATITVAGAGTIDLAVGGIAFSTSMPVAGAPFTITGTITNSGSAPAKNVAVSFFDGNPAAGGIQIGPDATIATVPAGGAGAASMTASLGAGTHTIFVVADRPNFIAESSEANNAASAALTVLSPTSPLPDLAVTALNVSNAAPKAGDAITITVLATNVGGAYSGPPSVVRIYDGDPAEGGVQVGSDVVLVLPTGSPATITLSASFRTGVHRIVAVADATGLVAESSETNNRLEGFINVSDGPLADLKVTTFTAAPTSVDSGQPVVLTATVENIGTRLATGFVVRFFDESPVGGRRVGFDFAVAELPPGGTTTVQTVAAFPPGSHTLFAFVDATNRVAEVDESNNVFMGNTIAVSTTVFVDPQVFTEEGTDLWLAVPPFLPVGATAFVRITAEASGSATVAIPGSAPSTVAVAPGVPVTVTIPVIVATTQATAPGGVQTGKGVHITSTTPVRAWLAAKTGTGDAESMIEATLVLPTPSLGTSYRLHSFGGSNMSTGTAGLVVLAVGSGTTEVTVDIAGPTPAVTKTMSAGDAIHLSQLVDPSGTTVVATQPVVCYSYTTGSGYPSGGVAGSSAILEQMLPASMPAITTGFLGKRFFIAPQLDALSSQSFRRARVMSHEDGTVVTIKRNGSPDVTLTLAAGAFTDVDVRTPTEILLSKPGSVVRHLPVAMAVVPPLSGYASAYRMPVFKTGTTPSVQRSTYATILAPLDGTRIASSNGLPASPEVETRSANAFETLSDEVRFSNEALWSPREAVSATLAEEIRVRAGRPVQMHVFRGFASLSSNQFAYLGGYRFTTKPDLVPSAIVASASEFFTGTPVTLSARILNMGFGDAGAFRVQFYDGDPEAGGILIADVAVAGLAREEDVVVTTGLTPETPNWTPNVPGPRTLTVVVDPLGTVDEGDETNNRLTRTEIAQAVTLVSGQLALGGTTFLGNQNVNIATALSNLSTNAVLGKLTDGQVEIVIEDLAGNVIARLPIAQVPELAAVPAGMQDWRFYLEASVAPAALRHGTQLLGGNTDFSALLRSLGAQKDFDLESIRVFEVTGDTFRERPGYLIPATDFNLASRAAGKVEWAVPGPLTPGVTRRFRIYFDSLDVAAKPAVPRLHEPAYVHGGGIYNPGVFQSNFTHTFVLSNRKGAFSIQPIPTTGAGALDEYLFLNRIVQGGVACQDLTGDGFLDALRTNDESSAGLNDIIYLARTSGSNTLVTEQPSILSVFPGVDRKIRTHDLNGDEFEDVMVLNRNDGNEPSATNSPFFARAIRVQAYLGRRDGTFRLAQEFLAASDAPGTTPTIAGFDWDLADANGDGKVDLILAPNPNIVTTQAPTVRVFLGTGTGTFSTGPVTTTYAVGALGNQQNFTAGDFDSDGKVDLVFLPDSANPITARFLKGNGDGTFAAPVTISTTALPAAVNAQDEKKESFDFDRSGTRDVMYATEGAGTDNVRVGFGNGSGTFPTGKGATVPGVSDLLAIPKMELAPAAIATSARNAKFLRDFVFNTNGLLPGQYRVRMNVYGADNRLLFTTTSDFEVISPLTGGTPADITEARVITDKATYAAGETATMTSTTINASTNATLTGLTVNVAVSGPSTATPSPATKTIATLAAGATDNLVSTLAIGTLAPGTYTVTTQVLQGATVIATDDATFGVAPTFRFTGSASANPPTITPDAGFAIDYSLTNLGNIAATDAAAQFLVVNPTTGSVLATYTASVTVATGATASGSVAATASGLTPGTYAIVFRILTAGQTFSISRTFFTVAAPGCAYLNFAAFGSDFVKLAGTASTNDVDSGGNGDVFSNTAIQVLGQATVGGDATSAGGAGSITVGSNASITGTTTTGAAPIALPALDTFVDGIAIANSNGSIGLTADGKNPLAGTEFTLSANDSITLAPGFYYFTKFKVNGTLTVGPGGAAVIALAGSASIQSGALVNSAGTASQVLLASKSTQAVSFAGQSTFVGTVVAPVAAISLTGQTEVRGAVVGKSVVLSGQAKLRYSTAAQSACALLPP